MLASNVAAAAGSAEPTRKSMSSAESPIVVEGRRSNERYRIPQELRTLPPEYDRHARASDPRLACRAVGPMGCGITPNRLLTVSGDGKVQFGPAKQ